MPDAPVIPDDHFSRSYEWAVGFAERRAAGFVDAADPLLDAATEGLLWARAHCRTLGEWDRFSRASVMQAVGRAYAKCARRAHDRPGVISIDPDESHDPRSRFAAVRQQDLHAVTAEVPLLIADLPEVLAFTVRLYFVDGHSLRDCGLLLGCSQNTVKRRLHQAAALLAPGRIEPERIKGTKRLHAG